MGSSPSDEPFDVSAAGERASEAFAILGNETRLRILVALWEAYEPFGANEAVRFSALRDRVGTVDSGQFNYHLDRLVGRFVESTADGYALTKPGRDFVQSVVAGVGIDDPTLEPTDVDVACTMCGGQVQIAYDDGWVTVRCTDCDGLWTDADDASRGHLAKFALHPAGLANRTPDEIYAAAWIHGFQQIYGLLEGVCPTCSGPVERALDVCGDHADEGVCPTCDRMSRVGARAHCTVCKDLARMTPGVVAKYHPAVVGFFHDHGLDLQYGFNDLDRIERRLAIGDADVDILAADPPHVRVTHEVDGERVVVELDVDLDVVSVTHADATT